uniref:Uncharacterized protein n=1 Tax=Setaria italica TaxID=4555 RepID=K3XTI6_SETIT
MISLSTRILMSILLSTRIWYIDVLCWVIFCTSYCSISLTTNCIHYFVLNALAIYICLG